MKKYLKQIAVLLLTLVFVMQVVPTQRTVGVLAAEDTVSTTNGEFSVPFTIKEQNGIEVKDYFFRRGIPVEKGRLYSTENLCVKENGKEIISSIETLQKHLDGSISWILVSAKVDLKPHELKKLEVTNGKSTKGRISVVQKELNTTLTSSNLELIFANEGIKSIKYNNEEQLTRGSLNIYVNIGNKVDYLKTSEISVLKQTDSYTKVKLKGKIRDDVDGEMYVTVAEDSSKFEVEYRINVKETLDILSTGLKIGCVYKGAEKRTIVTDDCLDLGKMQLISYDNTRFRMAAADENKTGYIIEEDSIRLAPIVNERIKTYYDGLSRTNHLHITFSGDAQNWDKTQNLLPIVTIPPEQFVKAGQILTTQTGALVDEAIESFKFSYTRRNGRFEAGAIPRVINTKLGVTDGYDSQAGEVGYNLGLAYMQTGDPELYRYIDECIEARADIVIYRGKYPEIVGDSRTRMGQFTTDYAFKGHPYYGDQSSLYMGYLLTGNEYVGETFKLSMEHDLKYMYSKEAVGSYVPLTWGWSKNSYVTPSFTEYYEIRGAIRARTMYLAYLHFGDERYLKASRDIIKWTSNVQWPNGSFVQATYDNGTPYMQDGQTQYPNKDYISLYGLRGISHVLEFDQNEKTAREVTLKFADYLCTQNETFGPGFWYPNGDVEVYAVNENDTRGKSPMTDVLAVDVLCTAYEITGQERYFKNMLSLLESYICSATGGLSFWYTALENTPWVVSEEVDSTRCSSLLKSSDNIMMIMNKNRERAIELGFENVALVFTDGAQKEKEAQLLNYEYPEVTQNTFKYGDTKAFFAANNYAPYSGEWKKTLQFVFDENKLWQGEKNVVNNAYSVTLEKDAEQYDNMTAIQRPVSVDEIYGTAEIFINEYCEDKIEIEYSGNCELGLKIENGLFKVDNAKKYNVKAYSTPKGAKVVVTTGGSISPVNGVLYIKLNQNGKLIENVAVNALKKTGLKNVLPESALSRSQLESIIEESFGKKVTLHSDFPVWEEFAPEILSVFKTSGINIFEKTSIHTATNIIPKSNVSDEEAVRLASNAINIEYDGEKLSSDVFLPTESLYSTVVTWASEDESVLSSTGVLTRNNIKTDSIKLTATISKNQSSVKKEFIIPLLPVEKISQKPSSNIPETAFPLVTQTQDCEVVFTCIPKEDKIDGIIIIGDSDYPSDSLINTSYMIRFNQSGFIDAVDVYWTDAENVIPYEKGKKYTFRVKMYLKERRYDAYVTPEGGEEILLAKYYVPRNTGYPVNKVDVMWLWTSALDTYELIDCSLFAYKKTEIKNNYLYDKYNLMFGKYNVNNTLKIPQYTEYGKILNWVESKSTIKENEGNVSVYFGLESDSVKEKTIMDVLKTARIIDLNRTGTDYVTAGDIARILTIGSTMKK